MQYPGRIQGAQLGTPEPCDPGGVTSRSHTSALTVKGIGEGARVWVWLTLPSACHSTSSSFISQESTLTRRGGVRPGGTYCEVPGHTPTSPGFPRPQGPTASAQAEVSGRRGFLPLPGAETPKQGAVAGPTLRPEWPGVLHWVAMGTEFRFPPIAFLFARHCNTS